MKLCLQRIVVIGYIGLIVGLGMVSTIAPWRRTPAGRSFNGMHGFSDDYTGYVSYIKEGIDGRSWVTIRSLPLPQNPTTIHQAYLWIGYVGRVFGMSAPLSYHLARLTLGVLFVFLVYHLFLTLLGQVDVALLGTLVAFGATSLSWFGRAFDVTTVRTLSSFPFAVDVSGRATGRPHYLIADALVISIILLYISRRPHTKLVRIFVVALSLLLGIIHPAFGVIVGFFSAMALVGEIRKERKIRFSSVYVLALGGLFCSLLVSYWSTHQYPFVSILAFEGYVLNEHVGLGQLWAELLAFGPVLWLAMIGFFWAIVAKPTRGTALMMYWLAATLLLFFFLFGVFRAERVRFIQSLYFVPMAYGAMLFFVLLARRIGRWVVPAGATLLILGSAPAYVLALYQTTNNLTDYKEFSTWTFPTAKQMEAYRWMDRNTPKESTVLAGFEAVNNILLYSHNFVMGNRQGWTREAGDAMEAGRTRFFSGTLSAQEAAQYVSGHTIRFLYVGYQERGMGDISKYPFLLRVFDNGEVTIYEVKRG